MKCKFLNKTLKRFLLDNSFYSIDESYLNNRYMIVQISDEGLDQISFSAWEKNN
jgi:hypothetical protein